MRRVDPDPVDEALVDPRRGGADVVAGATEARTVHRVVRHVGVAAVRGEGGLDGRTPDPAAELRVSEAIEANGVLDRLDEALGGCHKLRVLGAGRFPVKSGDWDRIKLGETAFRHKSVPADWWREYLTLARVTYDPIVMLARVSLAPFTWSEGQTMLDLVGADRWVYDLGLKYGMRDGFTCPIGARWMVSF